MQKQDIHVSGFSRTRVKMGQSCDETPAMTDALILFKCFKVGLLLWLSKTAPSEEFDQTEQMRQLIRIFSGCTWPNVCFLIGIVLIFTKPHVVGTY